MSVLRALWRVKLDYPFEIGSLAGLAIGGALMLLIWIAGCA